LGFSKNPVLKKTKRLTAKYPVGQTGAHCLFGEAKLSLRDYSKKADGFALLLEAAGGFRFYSV